MVINAIYSDFVELKIWFSNWLFYRRHAIKMRLAIRLADMKQRAFNKRYFIVLLETPKGDKLISINNSDFKRLKRKKWLSPKMGYLELEEECFYQTDLGRNNSNPPEERKKAKEKYLRYAKKYMR